MTPERQQLVRDSWRHIEPIAIPSAQFFYDKLFELDPECQAMFKTATMDEQRHRLMEMLGQLVAEMHEPEQLVGDLVMLGKRHVVYGVRDSDYDAAGVALLWTLEKALGSEFTPEARSAWTEAYQSFASVMRRVGTVITGAHKTA